MQADGSLRKDLDVGTIEQPPSWDDLRDRVQRVIDLRKGQDLNPISTDIGDNNK